MHVWHPYTQHALARAPHPISRASGAYLYDDRGNAIFDAISSWWVTLHGHVRHETGGLFGNEWRERRSVHGRWNAKGELVMVPSQ